MNYRRYVERFIGITPRGNTNIACVGLMKSALGPGGWLPTATPSGDGRGAFQDSPLQVLEYSKLLLQNLFGK